MIEGAGGEDLSGTRGMFFKPENAELAVEAANALPDLLDEVEQLHADATLTAIRDFAGVLAGAEGRSDIDRIAVAAGYGLGVTGARSSLQARATLFPVSCVRDANGNNLRAPTINAVEDAGEVDRG